MKYIVVFDTNILLSALFSQKGSPFRCLALAKIGQVESVLCREILDEFAEKLLIKFKFSEEKAQLAIKEIEDFSRLVTISGKLKAVPNDPDDDMVIECAIAGKARHIVTVVVSLSFVSPALADVLVKEQSKEFQSYIFKPTTVCYYSNDERNGKLKLDIVTSTEILAVTPKQDCIVRYWGGPLVRVSNISGPDGSNSIDVRFQ